MALMESTMMDLGTKAPDFTLPDTVSGKQLGLYDDASGAAASLVMFICNHCPYVIHVKEQLRDLARDFQGRGVKIYAISSNDVKRYPQDGPELMKAFAQENQFSFPYLYDESQEVARAYDAACTPDFFLFDSKLELAYRGRLDESRPNSGLPVTGKDLRTALEQVLAGKSIPESEQYPSAGCSIKWLEN
jgi:peroxiredoxin